MKKIGLVLACMLPLTPVSQFLAAGLLFSLFARFAFSLAVHLRNRSIRSSLIREAVGRPDEAVTLSITTLREEVKGENQETKQAGGS